MTTADKFKALTLFHLQPAPANPIFSAARLCHAIERPPDHPPSPGKRVTKNPGVKCYPMLQDATVTKTSRQSLKSLNKPDKAMHEALWHTSRLVLAKHRSSPADTTHPISGEAWRDSTILVRLCQIAVKLICFTCWQRDLLRDPPCETPRLGRFALAAAEPRVWGFAAMITYARARV
jgi:hypothetical protein